MMFGASMAKRPHNDWKELATHWAPNHRPHAGHFSWETDRPVAEAGVLKEFEEALAIDGQEFFSQVRHRGPGNDPPDCEAINNTGARIGIEITELVDPASAAAARAGKAYDWKDWKPDLIPTLDRIIRLKDSPAALKDPPYSEYVLLVHTDEPWMELDHTRQSLADHIFPATSLITKAYLLISYDPGEKRYPYIRLNIGNT
ncbi:MAG: hypothetical protein ACE1Z4_02675 [Gammaproteobacteria bacterium]